MSTNSELRTVGLGFCWQDYEVGDRFQTIGRSITEADLVNFINTTGMTEVMFNNLVYIDEKSASDKIICIYIGCKVCPFQVSSPLLVFQSIQGSFRC